jgi:hypothetical protein
MSRASDDSRFHLLPTARHDTALNVASKTACVAGDHIGIFEEDMVGEQAYGESRQ